MFKMIEKSFVTFSVGSIAHFKWGHHGHLKQLTRPSDKAILAGEQRIIVDKSWDSSLGFSNR